MKTITQLEFGLMSPEDIRKLAVKEITRTEVYDADGYPVEDGVMDPALGVIDPGMICPTDGAGIKDSRGHFGFIDLAMPVLHVLYVKDIRNILQFTCSKCQGLLKKDKAGPFLKSNLIVKCPKCEESQKMIKLEKPYFYYEGDQFLDNSEIRRRFENISDEDVKHLGIFGGRPEWLALTRVLVPPVPVRPSITLETGERSEDDLTHKLVDIIRINQRLLNNMEIGAPEFIIDDLWELLQYHVSTFFDNDLTGVPPARHRSGRALKSLVERLEGKEGRFRQNLIGKRANFSARTVISPDPEIDFEEVGVPYIIAQELTIPVRVSSKNIDQIKEMISTGDQYPAVNYVYRPDGTKRKVTGINRELLIEDLAEDHIVERNLIDGDVVLFNRQPSLHRMSLMAHKVRVMPYRTFRLNLIACAPYNADFDGDEMNLHAPQTEEAKTEARELLLISNHIKSPKTGAPVLGFIQDHISGLYTLSKSTLTREEAFDLLVSIGEYSIELPEKKSFAGSEIISLFIPDGIDIRVKTSGGEALVVKKGVIQSGVMDNKSIGSGGELINQIHLRYGRDVTARFLNKLSRLGARFLARRGFSISVSDLEVSDKAQKKISETIENGVFSAQELIKDYEAGKIEATSGRTPEQTLENMITINLRKVSTDVQNIVKEYIPQTSARIMAESGARGSMTNLSLMSGLLGQESVRGARISRGFKHRTTSHFKPRDLGPKARGFVSSSIIKGLDPIESFYEIMSQREGLMDTSLRTRTSGYMYRRVANALQDLRVVKDGSVRSSNGNIVQFVAGEDGIDPSKSNRGGSEI